jgi:hypothetical protein
MESRAELVAHIAERTRRRFAPGGPASAHEGELSAFLASEIQNALGTLHDPFCAVIRGWEGQAWQLDLTWWEGGEHPEEIVYGLAGAILDFEVRKRLELPV